MSAQDHAIRVDEKKLFTIPGTILISVIGLAGAIGIGWANLRAQVNEIPAIRARVDVVEQDQRKIDVLVNDVAWIKQELLRQAREERRASERSPGDRGGGDR